MARGDTTAQSGETAALGNSNTLNTNAQGVYGSLAPTLAAEVAHPAGYSPSDEAALNTAAQQSAGGSQAAAVGQGGLLAARTRNAGAPAAAIASSARSAGQGLSQAALKIAGQNADLKNRQQQEGIAGEEGLYGTGVSGGNQALGELANNANANTNASNASWNWAKYILDPAMQAAGSAAAGGAFGQA
jgi:hypothetical protein